MARSGERQGSHFPFRMTRRWMIVVTLAVMTLAALAVTVPFLIKRNREEMRKYSGAEADRSVQLLYDMDRIGEFAVVSEKPQPDGRYSEHIIVQNAIDVRLWRDFERPKLPCREHIEEKYPDLVGYSREKVPEGVFYSERGSFTVKDGNGKEYSHTVVLLRRGGWDYLVDLSVGKESREIYADNMDEIINHMILIP